MKNIPKILLLIETSREYGRGLLRGIAKWSNLHGPWLMYQTPPFYIHNKPDRKRKKTPTTPNLLDADGIIMREQGEIDDIISLGKPTILVSYLKNEISSVPRIVTNDDEIGELACDHFLERGFSDFAYCGLDYMYWSRNRAESFSRHIKNAGHEVRLYSAPMRIRGMGWNEERLIIAEWLSSLPKPIALFVCNDDRGRQVIEACRMKNIKVPEEIAVLGVDDDEFTCNLVYPALSSIALSTERAGYEAAEKMNALLNNEPITSLFIEVFPTHITTRLSTDIMAIEDKDIAAALQYIRHNIDMPLQVNEVANAVGISRCCLHQKFRKFMGRSVHSEIKRQRIKQISELLLTTDLSISQIAYKLGFTSIGHIARYYRMRKGMTPLAYRKKYGSSG